MVTAIVLMNIERGRISEVAETLAGFEQVSEVYSVAGSYDAVAIVRVRRNDDLADFITGHVSKIDAIDHTETMLAFRTYSRHDLESMFALGQ
jgi:DNA-binding Lrp family transcriptional regulator